MSSIWHMFGGRLINHNGNSRFIYKIQENDQYRRKNVAAEKAYECKCREHIKGFGSRPLKYVFTKVNVTWQ